MTRPFSTVVVLSAMIVAAQSTAPQLPYETLFYVHENLRLESYLYKPRGTGPFPLVVYNHGSVPPEQERDEWPAPFVAHMLVPAGYALLVPERRGYGKSDGDSFSKLIGQDRGSRFVQRQRDEAGDVNAALENVLKTAAASIDPGRIVIMGASFGGIVTTLAASQSDRYAGVIVQAPGALNWDRSEALRTSLIAAAETLRVPVSCAVAENDATTESARAICAAAGRAGARTLVKVYPPFNSGRQLAGNPPGHALFGRAGVEQWKNDVLSFLAEVTRRP